MAMSMEAKWIVAASGIVKLVRDRYKSAAFGWTNHGQYLTRDGRV